MVGRRWGGNVCGGIRLGRQYLDCNILPEAFAETRMFAASGTPLRQPNWYDLRCRFWLCQAPRAVPSCGLCGDGRSPPPCLARPSVRESRPKTRAFAIAPLQKGVRRFMPRRIGGVDCGLYSTREILAIVISGMAGFVALFLSYNFKLFWCHILRDLQSVSQIGRNPREQKRIAH